MYKASIILSTAIFMVAICGVSLANEAFHRLPSGLEYKNLKIGKGEKVEQGTTVKMHFVGWVDDNGEPGKEIFNSRKEKKPVSFVVGTEKVMQGWNEGVIGMHAGGRRMLRIPPELGYGGKGVEGEVPPNSHLLFIIELLEVKN
jgi:FKBP-type peptidyl-prolyl cis-trans isomerase FkpA